MSQIDYQAQLEAANALDAEAIKTPYYPVSIYIQEAEDLHHWAQTDKAQLEAAGLANTLLDAMPVNAGALREAQSIWMRELKSIEEGERLWKERSPGAYDFRDQLLHTFRYAFRERADLLSLVDAIDEGTGHADLVQDLNDLAVLGKDNTYLLTTIGFDILLLDKAATDSDELASILAQANGDKSANNPAKIMRDRMYTLLKNQVDAVRACGKYVFWRDAARAKGYSSDYLKRKNVRNKKKEAETEANTEASNVDS